MNKWFSAAKYHPVVTKTAFAKPDELFSSHTRKLWNYQSRPISLLFLQPRAESHRLKHKNWGLINQIYQRPLTYSMKWEQRKFLTFFVSFLTTFCQSFETCTSYFPLELEFRHALKPGTPQHPGPLMNTKSNKAQQKKKWIIKRCSSS